MKSKGKQKKPNNSSKKKRSRRSKKKQIVFTQSKRKPILLDGTKRKRGEDIELSNLLEGITVSKKPKLNKIPSFFYLQEPDDIKEIIDLDEKNIYNVLLITDFEKYELDIQFAFIDIFHTIYEQYVPETQLDIDLMKKLEVFFCINPEIIIQELKYQFVPLNKKIIANFSKETFPSVLINEIKLSKQRLNFYVDNYVLIKETTTAEEFAKHFLSKINIVDCEFVEKLTLELKKKGIKELPVFYVNTKRNNNSLEKFIVYGFDKIINNFLYRHPDVVMLSFQLPCLKYIGNNFIMWCGKLTDVNFDGLKSLKNIGDNCLSFCSNLININNDGLISLQRVGDNWIYECIKVKKITFNLPKLEEVGYSWMENDELLEDITFNLPLLREVGGNWMKSCNFINPDLSTLTSLEEVGPKWLSENKNLTSPNFQNLTKLKRVENFWMFNCPNLTKPKLNGLTSLEYIGPFSMKLNIFPPHLSEESKKFYESF
jgi:hypothetical protein